MAAAISMVPKICVSIGMKPHSSTALARFQIKGISNEAPRSYARLGACSHLKLHCVECRRSPTICGVLRIIFEKALPRIVHNRRLKLAGRVVARKQQAANSLEKRVNQLVADDKVQVTDEQLGLGLVGSLADPNQPPYTCCIADQTCTCPSTRFCTHLHALSQQAPLTHRMRQQAAVHLMQQSCLTSLSAETTLLHSRPLTQAQKQFLIAAPAGQDASCSCDDWLHNGLCCHLFATQLVLGTLVQLPIAEPTDLDASIACIAPPPGISHCSIDDCVAETFVALSAANASCSDVMRQKVAADPALARAKSQCSTLQRLIASLPNHMKAEALHDLEGLVDRWQQSSAAHQFQPTDQAAGKIARKQLSRKPEDRVHKSLYSSRTASVAQASKQLQEQRQASYQPLAMMLQQGADHPTTTNALYMQAEGLRTSGSLSNQVPPHRQQLSTPSAAVAGARRAAAAAARSAAAASADSALAPTTAAPSSEPSLHEFHKVTAQGRPCIKVCQLPLWLRDATCACCCWVQAARLACAG